MRFLTKSKQRSKFPLLAIRNKLLKKTLLFLAVFILSALCVFADTVPATTTSIKYYGIGVFKIENDFSVYSEPNVKSKVLRKCTLPTQKNSAIVSTNSKSFIMPYIVSIPSQHLFFATVVDYPEDNWIHIYNQTTNLTGWVQYTDKSSFMTWKEFFYKYGKKNGLFQMRDIKVKRLYSQDDENSKIVDRYSYPEYIQLRFIRGNWMLVTVVDSGNVYKTGWLKWRTDDGKLRVFPNLYN